MAGWYAYRINEGAEVEKNSVESNDTHGLKRVAVYNVATRDCVSHLDTSGD